MKRTLKIGLSARLAHPRPDGKGLESKTLQYLEQSVAQWIMAALSTSRRLSQFDTRPSLDPCSRGTVRLAVGQCKQYREWVVDAGNMHIDLTVDRLTI